MDDGEIDPQDVRNHLSALEQFENMATIARLACYTDRRRLNHNYLKIVGDQLNNECIAKENTDEEESENFELKDKET